MEFTSSIRRKQKILHEGYIYVFQKNLANDLRSYECENRRNGQCKAKIKVDLGDEIVGRVNQHTHAPSAVKVEMNKVRSNIRESAETSHQTPQNIIANELATTSTAVAANLPRIEHLKRTVRGQRGDDHPPNPITKEEIPFLPVRYQQTLNGDRFLLFDSGPGDEDRMLIFATDQALELLSTSDDWYCDGTFSVCPEIFFQLYTVHARYQERTIPCIFGLLKNKTRITYERFFNELSNHMQPGYTPTTILFDFELATINAARQVFPNADISGCFFHLSSNIWKKIQSIGLHQRYNVDLEFALHVRMIPALAFVPSDQVVDVFERVSDQITRIYADEVDLMNQLLIYFEDNYIGRLRRNAPRAAAIFPIQMWNMFNRTQQEMPRTNNNIEGWHRRFQGICNCFHPSFWKFIEMLKKEQSLNRLAIVQAEAGHPPPAQRRRYVNCNERILAIVDDFPNRDTLQYVRSIAHNLQF